MAGTIRYARALNQAALRHNTIRPKRPNPKADRRQHYFLLGRDDIDLAMLRTNTIVWALTSFTQILKDHSDTDIIVLKKGTKAGIVGAQVVGGPKIHRGVKQPIDITLEEYLAGYRWVAKYLAEYGVTFSSLSWASEQIFRMQFRKPLTISNPIGRFLLQPSRGICSPGHTYRGRIEKWDIRSAYPAAMLRNASQFPTKFIPIEASEWNKRPLTVTLARVLARPTIPDRVSPITPEHYTQAAPRITIRWFWRFELETIAEQNHYIEPLVSFKITTSDLSDEIGGWLKILSPRYDKGMGFAGKLLKGVANALWGSFAAGDMYSYTWKLDDSGNATVDKKLRRVFSGRVGGEHVGAWVNALVSDRVYREFINPEQVLYFDTDGGFCYPTSEALGSGNFGEWRYEGTYYKLEVVDWQAYAAWGDRGPEVTISGVPGLSSYKDLRRYGGDKDRRNYLLDLMESNPFNRIAGIHSTLNQATTIPPKVATLNNEWLLINPTIAPPTNHLTLDTTDMIEVNAIQAEGLRTIAGWEIKPLDSNG